MTTNDIIDAVSVKLNDLFKEFAIYTNSVKQGLEFPCFFIKTLPSNKSSLLMNRYYNETNLVIHAMLEEDTELLSEELNNIGDMLYDLEYIELPTGGILRGTDIKKEISDGVLLFFITYKYFTTKDSVKEENMETLTTNGRLLENE